MVGRFAGVFSERTFLKIGLLIANLAGLALLVALLVKAPLIAVAIPIFFLSHQLESLVPLRLH